MNIKKKVFLSLIFLTFVIISGCSLTGSSDNVQEQANQIAQLESNLGNSISKISLKIEALKSNDLSSDVLISSTENDLQILNTGVQSGMDDLEGIENILVSWENNKPNDITKTFLGMYKESIQDYKLYLEKALEFNSTFSKYVDYRKDDVEYNKLIDKGDVTFSFIDQFIYLEKYDDAIMKVDEAISIINQMVEISRRQAENQDVQISVNQKILIEDQKYLIYATEFKKGLENKKRNPNMDDTVAYKGADEAYVVYLQNVVSQSEIDESYSAWKDKNLYQKISNLNDIKVDADFKYDSAFRYLKNNQGGKIIFSGNSAITLQEV